MMKILLFALLLFASCDSEKLNINKITQSPLTDSLFLEKIGVVSVKYVFSDKNNTIEVITNKPVLSRKVFNEVLGLDYVVGLSGAGDIYHTDTENDRHRLVIKWIENRDTLTTQLKQTIKKHCLLF